MGDASDYTTIREDWSTGELSPSWQGRISSPEYKSGSALLYNMLPRSGGGVRRRPGSRFIDVPTIDAGTNARLFPFTGLYGDQLTLVVCLASSVATIYVYSMATHAMVGTITTNVPAYKSADIPCITYAQTNGMTWLFMGRGGTTTGGLPVCYVDNSSADLSGTWQCTQPIFVNDYSSFLVTASADLTSAAYGGLLVASEWFYGNGYVSDGLTAATAEGYANIASATARTASLLPATATASALVAAASSLLSASSSLVTAIASLTGHSAPAGVIQTVDQAQISAQAAYSSAIASAGNMESFDASNHYPSCGEFYAGRLFMASTNANPLAVWGSSIPPAGVDQDYLTFTVGPVATDGIYLLQNDIHAPGIRWLFASQQMLAATDRSVWMEQPENFPAPATFAFKKSASYGALAASRPVQVVNVALYLGSEQKSFRSLILSIYRGFYADGNLSEHAEHLMARKTVDFAVTLKPDPTAWILMEDGTIVSATVKQEDSGFVVKAGCGFAQHALGGGGLVKAICQLTNVNYDELWMLVLRGTSYSLEYLYLDDINSTPQVSSFYVDCGQTQSTAGQTTFTGLPDPLEGETVVALGDGGVMSPAVVSGGSVTYSLPVSILNVGFPYYSAWQDLRPQLPAKGASMGKIKKPEKSWMLVYNSLGGWIGQEPPSDPLNDPGETLADFWDKIQSYGTQLYGSAPSWVSGIIDVDHADYASPDGQVYLCISDPVPFNLVALTTRFALSET